MKGKGRTNLQFTHTNLKSWLHPSKCKNNKKQMYHKFHKQHCYQFTGLLDMFLYSVTYLDWWWLQSHVPEQDDDCRCKRLEVVVAMYHRFTVQSNFAENLCWTSAKAKIVMLRLNLPYTTLYWWLHYVLKQEVTKYMAVTASNLKQFPLFFYCIEKRFLKRRFESQTLVRSTCQNLHQMVQEPSSAWRHTYTYCSENYHILYKKRLVHF